MAPRMINSRLRTSTLFLFVLIFSSGVLKAQELDDLLDDMEGDHSKTEFVSAAFKATRVINLQSVEMKAPGALEFRIAHRFGALNGGFYQLFGLDQASIRFSLEYGISDWLMAGFGRSSYEKTWDAYAKVRLIRQKTGAHSFPFSILYYANAAVNGLKWQDPDRENYFASRLSYVHQLIIGSKISEALSLQISPTLVHKNIVPEVRDQNNMFALGLSGRVKLSNRVALTSEYIYRLPPEDKQAPTYESFYNSFSLGVDIETGGHVFQIHLTNSLAMFDRAFITETSKSWSDGGIHLGFNITRDFNLKRKKITTYEDD